DELLREPAHEVRWPDPQHVDLPERIVRRGAGREGATGEHGAPGGDPVHAQEAWLRVSASRIPETRVRGCPLAPALHHFAQAAVRVLLSTSGAGGVSIGVAPSR